MPAFKRFPKASYDLTKHKPPVAAYPGLEINPEKAVPVLLAVNELFQTCTNLRKGTTPTGIFGREEVQFDFYSAEDRFELPKLFGKRVLYLIATNTFVHGQPAFHMLAGAATNETTDSLPKEVTVTDFVLDFDRGEQVRAGMHSVDVEVDWEALTATSDGPYNIVCLPSFLSSRGNCIDTPYKIGELAQTAEYWDPLQDGHYEGAQMYLSALGTSFETRVWPTT